MENSVTDNSLKPSPASPTKSRLRDKLKMEDFIATAEKYKAKRRTRLAAEKAISEASRKNEPPSTNP